MDKKHLWERGQMAWPICL